MRCRLCGKYTDLYEWPQDHIDEYKPRLCYDCYLLEQEREAREEEEAANFDPNTEYGMSEVHPDPEDDDTPDLGIEDTDISEELEEGTTNDNENPNTINEASESIINLQRLLFG